LASILSFLLGRYFEPVTPADLFMELDWADGKTYIPATFERIKIGAKIMPSEVNEANMVIMTETNSASSLSQNFSPETANKLAETYNSRQDYFVHDFRKEYFPKLVVTD